MIFRLPKIFIISLVAMVMSFIMLVGSTVRVVSAEEVEKWIEGTTVGNPNAKITLTFQTHLERSPFAPVKIQKEAFEDLYINWAKTHPDVKVKLTFVAGPTDIAMTKLLEEARVGKAPDIAFVDSMMIKDFIKARAPQTLNEFVSKEMLEDYFPFARSLMTDDEGNIYGLYAFTDFGGVLFYREDLVGLPPRTWDKLIEKASSVAKKKGMIGYLYSGGRWEGTWYSNSSFFYAQGGRLTDESGRPVFGIGENREYMLNMLRFLRDTVTSGATPVKVASITDYNELLGDVSAGKVAMFQGGSWQVRQLEDMLPPEEFRKWNIAPLPQIREGLYDTMCGGWLSCIFTADPIKKKAAFDLIM